MAYNETNNLFKEDMIMGKMIERNMEMQFEAEQEELISEKAIMRECARQEFWANQRLKQDKNRDWKSEDGDFY